MDSVVLLSGGFDSTVCLFRELEASRETCGLGIDYGQPHSLELVRAKRIADAAGVPFRVATARFDLGSSLLSDGAASSPVLPCRNVVLASLGAAEAVRTGARRVVIGACADDHETFPDCRPAFINALSDVTFLAVGVNVFAPLCRSTKAEAIHWASKRADVMAALRHTWSCYTPYAGRPCGECLACETRAAAFAEAGVVDPAVR